MKALILAGGKGTRLAPFTATVPKPLFPLGDRTILEIVVGQLKRAGVKDMVFAVGYLAELVEAYFGNGRKFGVKISYARETRPLGTAGPIKALKGERSDFLVMNGDVLADMDFGDLIKAHKKSGSIATICCYRKKQRSSLGMIEHDRDGYLTDYHEKPEYTHIVSTGIYCFSPEALKFIKKGEHLDLPELMIRLKDKGMKVKVFMMNGDWFDIGTPEDYSRALDFWEKNGRKRI
ncbi:MAG: sugar phosphate nucleotidyltransferase [Candidatus Omnitrophica bacterium]|nr:sugar phosphate nucleotidyltransferase [Candidatus Omnitrophota bacterium]